MVESDQVKIEQINSNRRSRPRAAPSFYFINLIRKYISEYLFSYDARGADADVYNNIREILTGHHQNVNRPVESTYIFERDGCPIDDLRRELECLFRGFNMAFVVARLVEDAYSEGASALRRKNRRLVELMKG